MERKKVIKKFLIDKDMTQRELARQAGLSETVLSLWLSGRWNFNSSEELRISEVLDIPVDQL